MRTWTPPKSVRSAAAVAAASAAAILAGGCDPAGAGGGQGGQGAPAADAPDAPATAGFVEEGKQRGLDFRMHFLPTEQGRNFKMNLYDHGAGVALADVDGDGDDDVYLLDQLGPNRLFRNDGGRFTDVTDASGVGLGDRICVAALFADFDGDGDADLYVTSTRGGNALLRNDGGAKFTDVSAASGTGIVAHSQSALAFDHDGDGDLDLFVANTAEWTNQKWHETERYYEGGVTLQELLKSPEEKSRLYRNDGGLRFTDVTDAAGVGRGWAGDASAFDFDEDGDQDLFVANMFGGTALYRNVGDGTFADVTVEALGKPSWGAVGAKVVDFENDGMLDFFIVDMHSDMWVPMDAPRLVKEKARFDGPEGPMVEHGLATEEEAKLLRDQFKIREGTCVYGNTLFRNQGGGRFKDVAPDTGLETFWPWGVAVADFDLDGDQDAFLPSGMGYPWFYWRSPLLVNQGDGTFVDRCVESGIEPPPGGAFLPDVIGPRPAARSFRSAATSDLDGDGRPDLVVNAFNDRALLWMNRFPARRWIAFDLVRANAAHPPVGAIVSVRAGGTVQTQLCQPTGGYLAQSSARLHFGLGDAAQIESVEIRWPGGAKQTLPAPAVDRVHRVVEAGDGSKR